jgi:hypothetical protein
MSWREKTPNRLLFMALDMAAVNVVFYLLLRSAILHPLNYHSVEEIVLWGALLLFVLYVTYALQPKEIRRRIWIPILQWGLIALFVKIVYALSNEEVINKGYDFSWLRPEVVKVPLWWKLLVPISPIFTCVFFLAVGLIIFASIKKPKSLFIPVIPTLLVAVLIWKIHQVFAPFGSLPVKGVSEPVNKTSMYLIMFAGPPAIFCLLLWMRAHITAFRIAPAVLHMLLIGLNYIGILPVHSVRDIIPFTDSGGAVVRAIPGATIVYPFSGAKADSSFLFLRKMVVIDKTIYVNYGPTCGLYAIDRETLKADKLPLPGLLRDLQIAPDGKNLWGTDCTNGDFMEIRTDPLSIGCVKDIFEMGITTPYNFISEDERFYISNVTHPRAIEMSWEDKSEPCSIKINKSLDLFKTGFTRFTDGAFSIHLDRENGKLYVNVGLVDETDLNSVAEIDLSSFHVTRSAKMTGGTWFFPIDGRRILVPSFYNADLHDLSLDSMSVTRTIKAGPNIVSLAHDKKRGLFYALCRSPGTLQIISDKEGRVIRELPVGAKPEPLWLDEKNDSLLLGSAIGILQIDLPRFFKE